MVLAQSGRPAWDVRSTNMSEGTTSVSTRLPFTNRQPETLSETRVRIYVNHKNRPLTSTDRRCPTRVLLRGAGFTSLSDCE